MKSVVGFFFIATFLIAFNANAQWTACGTNQDEAFMKRLDNNVANKYELSQKQIDDKFIPVHIHIATDNDGTNGISKDEVIDIMCVLNNRFGQVGMFYYIDDITFLNNSDVNHRPGISSAITAIRAAKNPDAMNIVLVNEILNQQFQSTGAAGYYSGGNANDFIVMQQNTPGDDGFTMEHEIGHFFSLSHTHFGWEGDISQGSNSGGYQPDIHGDTVRIEVITGSTQAPDVDVELVDGSNCTFAGDRICDTPPDYGFGQSCTCCTMIYDVWDRNGDKIEPMINNIMSYSQRCDSMVFTSEQELVMKADLASNRRSYLRTGEVTEYTPIASSVNITQPSNFEIVDAFDGVLITWDPVANTEEYIVNISGTQQLRYETTDTELFITELQPNSPYFIGIQARNKFGTGCYPETRILFDTGSGTTSVNETSSISRLSVSPNPVRSGDNLNLNISSDKKITSRVKLHNIQGHIVQNNIHTFASGNSSFAINTYGLSQGLYIIEVETEEGIITEKVIIE